jgi:sugar lactone lactonase YvrE
MIGALIPAPAMAASTDIIVTYAGKFRAGDSGDGGPALQAKLNGPTGVAEDAAGNLFIADTGNNRVRVVGHTTPITAYAGSGVAGYAGDGGPATAAELNGPTAVAVDSSGTLYIADTANNVVRKVTIDGTISTFAGTGAPGYSGDGGQASAATLNAPGGLAVDSAGDVYVADTGNNVVRKVSPSGIITTFAGTGTAGFSGNGRQATKAQLQGPTGLAVTSRGDLLISDTLNNQVRVVRIQSGKIVAFAGTGDPGFSGDGGKAVDAMLRKPMGVAVDPTGYVYIVDTFNERVRAVTPSGKISTFAGTGEPGDSGDGGPADQARVKHPTGVVAGADSVYLGDTRNDKVRRIHHGGPPPVVSEFPLPWLLPVALLAGAGGTISVRRRRRSTAGRATPVPA